MESKNSMNRRKFIGSAVASAAAITVVPRHVLGGSGFIAPSDKITVANIGCGTQGLGEMPGMLQNPDLQVVAVCDVNKFTTYYLDCSPDGILNSVRETLEDPSWGSKYKGIPGGRDIGKEYVEKYYGKNQPSGTFKGCKSYEDDRELLEKEPEVDIICSDVII